MRNGLLAVALVLAASWASAQSTATPPAIDEPFTQANLERLRAITLSSNKAANLDARVAKMLGLGSEGDTIAVKQFRAETAIGVYVFTIPVKPAGDTVVFSFRDPSGVTYNYLSDSKRILLAAMTSDADGNHTVSKEEAEEGFRNTLQAWGQIARRVKFP